MLTCSYYLSLSCPPHLWANRINLNQNPVSLLIQAYAKFLLRFHDGRANVSWAPWAHCCECCFTLISQMKNSAPLGISQSSTPQILWALSFYLRTRGQSLGEDSSLQVTIFLWPLLSPTSFLSFSSSLLSLYEWQTLLFVHAEQFNNYFFLVENILGFHLPLQMAY